MDKGKIKILFVLKERMNYGAHNSGVSYGLINSVKHVGDSLEPYGIESKISIVVDNNQIDREIYHYKPTHVFIEALWVLPQKFPILMKLHPKVKFNVRLHSNLPFLSQESIAFQWLKEYHQLSKQYPNFSVSANNMKLVNELNYALNFEIKYTPNCYILNKEIKLDTKSIGDNLDIGCFSALRILKNLPSQAIAAIYVAKEMNKKLRFHINHTVFEQAAGGVIKNLRNMFAATKYELVEHEWQNLKEFKHLIRKMDVGMQVSMSETYNLVSSDFISCGVPIVGSSEIEFLSPLYQAAPTNFNDIVDKLSFAIKHKISGTHKINEILLRHDIDKAIVKWLEYLT